MAGLQHSKLQHVGSAYQTSESSTQAAGYIARHPAPTSMLMEAAQKDVSYLEARLEYSGSVRTNRSRTSGSHSGAVHRFPGYDEIERTKAFAVERHKHPSKQPSPSIVCSLRTNNSRQNTRRTKQGSAYSGNETLEQSGRVRRVKDTRRSVPGGE